jgi:hypothetical protein
VDVEVNCVDRVVVQPLYFGQQSLEFVDGFELVLVRVLLDELLVVRVDQFSGFVDQVLSFSVSCLGACVGLLPSENSSGHLA